MGDRVDVAECDQSVRQETERPAAPALWRASAGQGDEVGLLLAVEHSPTARDGTANEGPIKTPFDEGAADPVSRRSRNSFTLLFITMFGERRTCGGGAMPSTTSR